MAEYRINMTPTYKVEQLAISQNDIGRVISIYLVGADKEAFIIPTGAAVQLLGTKPSGLGFTVNGTWSGSTVEFEVTAEMSDEAGHIPCEVKITSSGSVIGSSNADLYVEMNPHPSDVTDGTAEHVIDTITALVNRAEAAADDAEQSAAEAQSELDSINKIILLSNLDLENETSYDGYSENNELISNPGTSPFVLHKALGYSYLLKSLRLKAYNTGTLTIGTIKKADSNEGASYDLNNLNIFETINVSNTGDITYIFDTPYKVEYDENLFVQIPTDTLSWYYGLNGTDKFFLYVDPTTRKFIRSGNSLGVTVNIERLEENSIYKGKTLSILGDSISTFAGYIPSGNVTYYPSGSVTVVTDTWWKKLMSALGMDLNINNSWSGSRVTTTAGDTSAGCMSRCENLGTSPDVIIVWMGINDFNNEVQLGTYDGTTAIPSATTTFREAYGIMLNKILTKYQTSEVWVCTLPQCEENAGTGFPEINESGVALAEYNKAIKELADAFGVKVLDHNKCGLTYQNMPTYNPDNLHPNSLGHSLIANNDIRQMDDFVRTRY